MPCHRLHSPESGAGEHCASTSRDEFHFQRLSTFVHGPQPGWLVSDVLRGHFSFDATPAGWSAYVQHLVASAGDPAQQTPEQLNQFSHGWAIGSLGWKRALAREYSHLALHPGLPAQESRELKESRWREQLEIALAEFGKTPADLNHDSQLAAWKVMIAVRLRNYAAPYRWLAREMNLGAAGTLRVRLWRHARM